jgi:hypothetical protein
LRSVIGGSHRLAAPNPKFGIPRSVFEVRVGRKETTYCKYVPIAHKLSSNVSLTDATIAKCTVAII